MTLDTTRLSDVGEYLFDLLETNAAELGLGAVYYGDQERLPVTPAACIETGRTTKELVAIPRRVDTEFEAFIILYHNPVQDVSATRREVERLAEAVEDLVHTKPTLDGLVIHAFVSILEHGYVTKGGTVVRASRLLVTSKSKQNLPGF
jgi:hypothetical protein